jgi:hypothetical protein
MEHKIRDFPVATPRVKPLPKAALAKKAEGKKEEWVNVGRKRNPTLNPKSSFFFFYHLDFGTFIDSKIFMIFKSQDFLTFFICLWNFPKFNFFNFSTVWAR